MAGRLGLRFAANYHASPATVLEVIDAYRDAFVPSAGLEHPYVAVSAHAVVGSDDGQANQLAEGYPLWVLSVRSGQGTMPFPTPEEARGHPWTADERALVLDRAETQFVGSAQSVVSQLGWLQEATGADELMVTTITHRHEDRVRSYRLLAEEWMGGSDTGGRPPTRMHYPAPRRSPGPAQHRPTSTPADPDPAPQGRPAGRPKVSRRRWPPGRRAWPPGGPARWRPRARAGPPAPGTPPGWPRG